MDNTRDIYTDMGLVFPDLGPYSVKGWMKTVVSGPNNRFVDMDLRYIVIDRRTGKKVANPKGYPTALDAWRVCMRYQKATTTDPRYPTRA